nr:hypothetical transcript [Hymenolepis microstoma]
MSKLIPCFTLLVILVTMVKACNKSCPRSKEEETKEAVNKLIDEIFVRDLPSFNGTADQFVDDLILRFTYSLGLVPAHYNEGILDGNDVDEGNGRKK